MGGKGKNRSKYDSGEPHTKVIEKCHTHYPIGLFRFHQKFSTQKQATVFMEKNKRKSTDCDIALIGYRL
jgi:hypothetical protein